MNIKETSFKTESGSPDGGALSLEPLITAYTTSRKKEEINYFDKGGHFSYRNFRLLLLKEGGRWLPAPATVRSPPVAASENPPQPPTLVLLQ